jgi:hypothetical protein
MTINLRKSQLLISVFLSLIGLGFGDLETKAQTESLSKEFPLVSEIGSYNSNPEDKPNSLSQFVNVSELQDVEPTSWAYESLRNLVERYGCIVGYPDSTFRGDRSLTREEFAAGLNACLNSMEKLIQENTTIIEEDIETLTQFYVGNFRTQISF